jgi:hypothetical protein
MRAIKLTVGCHLATFLFIALGYLGVRYYLSSPDRLVSQLQQDLRRGDFDRLYSESSDFMKLNSGRHDFSRRLQIMSDHLKGYDPELNLKRDLKTDELLKNVFDSVEGDRRSDDVAISAQLLVGSVDDVHIQATWVRDWLEPRLLNISIQDFRQNRQFHLAGNPFDQTTK